MIVQLLIIIYLGILGYFYVNQSQYIFTPEKAPDGINRNCASLEPFTKVKSEDTTIYLRNTNFNNIIIYYHGNAGTVCHLADILPHYTFDNYNLALVEYSSYEDIDVEPSLKSIQKDVKNVISWVETKEIDNVIVAGYSLGTGSASYHVYKDASNVDKTILVSPYTNLVDVIKEDYWYLPVSFILRHNFKPDSWLKKSNSPVLIISGTSDIVIKHALSKELASSLPTETTTHVIIRGATHTTIRNHAEKIQAIRAFVLGD